MAAAVLAFHSDYLRRQSSPTIHRVSLLQRFRSSWSSYQFLSFVSCWQFGTYTMAMLASTAFVGTRVQTARRAHLRARPRFVVRASAETDRRKVLGTLLAGLAVLPAAAISATNPATRKPQEQRMGKRSSQIETEARGGRAQAPTSQRRGMRYESGQKDIGGRRQSQQVPFAETSEQQEQQRGGFFGTEQEQGREPIAVQARGGQARNPESLRDTRDRVKNSQRRLEQEVHQNLQRGDWDASSDSLRNQMASLRPDLNTLVSVAPNSKMAKERNKVFQDRVEKLEVAIRQKNKDEALKQYDSAIEQLDATISTLV